jgi:prepilin-type processing-associated H-X9-DG protein
MNKFRILLSLIVAATAGLFAWRHQSLRQLKTEREQLVQQSEEVSNLQKTIAQTRTGPGSPTNAGLSAAERSELLRLRGQVGPLRQELAQATNELANLSRPTRATSSDATEEPVVSKAEAMQKMSAGRQWIIALIMYAQDHQQQLPGTLVEAAPFAGTNKLDGAEFEFVRTNLDLTSIKSPATTIVLRETKSWKSYNGKWNRAYAFADGHVENAVTDTNDFTDWEAKHQPVEDQNVR